MCFLVLSWCGLSYLVMYCHVLSSCLFISCLALSSYLTSADLIWQASNLYGHRFFARSTSIDITQYSHFHVTHHDKVIIPWRIFIEWYCDMIDSNFKNLYSISKTFQLRWKKVTFYASKSQIILLLIWMNITQCFNCCHNVLIVVIMF